MSSIVLNVVILVVFVGIPAWFIYYASTSQSRKILKHFKLKTQNLGYKDTNHEILQSRFIIGLDVKNSILLSGDWYDDCLEMNHFDLNDFSKVKLTTVHDKQRKDRIVEIALVLNGKTNASEKITLFNAESNGGAIAQEVTEFANKWVEKINTLVG